MSPREGRTKYPQKQKKRTNAGNRSTEGKKKWPLQKVGDKERLITATNAREKEKNDLRLQKKNVGRTRNAKPAQGVRLRNRLHG